MLSLISGFTASNNYYGVNVGQLKNVAQPFWARLIEEGYTNSPPWTTNTTADDMDYAAVNIGQVKNAFSFDISTNAWPKTLDTLFTVDRGFYTTNISVTVSSCSQRRHLLYFGWKRSEPHALLRYRNWNSNLGNKQHDHFTGDGPGTG